MPKHTIPYTQKKRRDLPLLSIDQKVAGNRLLPLLYIDKKVIEIRSMKITSAGEHDVFSFVTSLAPRNRVLLPTEIILRLFTPYGIDGFTPSKIKTIAHSVTILALTCKGHREACRYLLHKLRSSYNILEKYGYYNDEWEYSVYEQEHSLQSGDRFVSCPAIFDLLATGGDILTIYMSHRIDDVVDVDKLLRDVRTIVATHPSALKFQSGIMQCRYQVSCFELAVQNPCIPVDFVKTLIGMGMPCNRYTVLYRGPVLLEKFLLSYEHIAYRRLMTILPKRANDGTSSGRE